ncbi:MAG TPA: hypothetical protein VG456_09990 [Candidatus Sulfopaludibacter sp.]|nr:hypothetical protein [Candidatus Sulfopaludibacter sp.]
MAPLFWSFGLEITLYGNDAQRLRVRLLFRALSLVVPVGGMLAVRAARSRRVYSNVVLGLATVLTMNLTNNLLRPQGSVLPMRLPLMILIMMYGGLPNEFLRQVIPPLIYTTGIILERALWLTGNGSGDFGSDVLILLFVNAVGIVMVYRRSSLEREVRFRFQAEQLSLLASHQALADLQRLRGIIPICSHCRKVRTEIGNWQQLEQYVAEHTDADFSHGICPVCMRIHYPNRKSVV